MLPQGRRMRFAQFSVVRCPVCGHLGKNLTAVDDDEEIACRFCRTRTKAARWTECGGPPIQPEEEEAKIRMELEKMVRYIKQLAGAIDMPMDEVVRMMQE